jgi:DNA repair exonuclease SbcCD nuclease subunit
LNTTGGETVKDGKLYGLAIADIHFGKKDDVKLSEELQEHFIPKIEKEKHDIDYVIVSGDLFDRVLRMNEVGSNICIRFVSQLLDLSIKYDFKLRILKGTKTHDYNQLNNFKTFEAKHYPRFRIIDTVETEEIFEDIHFLYMPEEYMDNQEEYYKEFFELEEGAKYDMIFFHGMFDFVGYVPDSESERHIKSAPTYNSDQIADLVYGKAIGGHIHTRHVYKDKIEYTSSFSRFAYGEDKPKGFLEVFYDPETLECETVFIENTSAPMYITVNIEEIEGETLQDKLYIINGLKEEYGNVKVKAKNVTDEDVSAMKVLVANDNNVKLDIKRSDIEEKIDEEYVFIIEKRYPLPKTIQEYVRLKQDVTLDLATIEKILQPE